MGDGCGPKCPDKKCCGWACGSDILRVLSECWASYTLIDEGVCECEEVGRAV